MVVCNWIHVAISYEQNSSLKIINNNLAAYDFNFLNYFENNAKLFNIENYDYAYKYAIVVDSNVLKSSSNYSIIEDGNDSSCIILNNTISTGFYNNVRYYYFCYLFCRSSANIDSNIFKGIYLPINEAPDDITPGIKDHLITLNGLNNIFQNNKVYRNLKEISSYICISRFYGFNQNDYVLTKGIITNNFFDSPYMINNISDGYMGSSYENITYPKSEELNNWIIKENINQTGFISIPLTNQLYIGGNIYLNSTHSLRVLPDNYVNFNYFNPQSKSRLLQINDLQTNKTDPEQLLPIQFSIQEDLNKYLPNNTKVISLDFSIKKLYGYVGSLTLSESIINLYLYKYNDASCKTISQIIYPSAILDTYIENDGNNIYGSLNYTQLNTANTNTISINLTKIDPATGGTGNTDVSNFYTIGKENKTISLSLSIYLQQIYNQGMSTSSGFSFVATPIFVKYRW